jgi:hypothetical protein
VVAHTDNPSVDFVTESVSGYSIDNLPPADPVNLQRQVTLNAATISWDPPVDTDYDVTYIYRNELYLDSTRNQQYVDESIISDEVYTYSIVHNDYNGNLSSDETVSLRSMAWGIHCLVELNDSVSEMVLAVNDDATYGLDPGLDIPTTPLPPSDYVRLSSHHPEWEYVLGDYFSQESYADISLTDTMHIWEMVLMSDNAGSASISFSSSDNLPPVPSFIFDEELSFKTQITDETTISTYLAAGIPQSLFVAVGDTTAPVVILHSLNGLEIVEGGLETLIEWDASGAEFTEVAVSYNGGEQYTILDTSDIDSAYVTFEDLLSNDCILRLVSFDFAENSNSTYSENMFSVAGHNALHSYEPGWYLWSSQLIFEDSIQTQISDDYEGIFFTYSWDEGSYSPSGTIDAGEGIWLGFDQPATFGLNGDPVLEPISVPYTPGWQIISNPLVRPVEKDSLFVINLADTVLYDSAVSLGWIAQPIYSYTVDQYEDSEQFDMWNAYWIGVLEENIQLLYKPHYQSAERENREIEYDWYVGINDLIIGSYSNSADAYDRFDNPMAPLPPNHDGIDMFINHDDWSMIIGDRFASDIRPIPEFEETTEYEIVLLGNGSIDLSWSIENIPDEVDVYLEFEQQLYDLKLIENLNLELEEALSGTLLIGTNVVSIRNDEIIPLNYSLNQNYPNPFNPTTTIRYGLPESSEVSLIIYNLNGREVTRLRSKTQDAGYYELNWNGMDESGHPVSTGIYLTRFQAGSYTKTIKMLYLK